MNKVVKLIKKFYSISYSVFFAFCFLAGKGFCDLKTALALRKAALVKSVRYLLAFKSFCNLANDLLGPDFIVLFTAL